MLLSFLVGALFLVTPVPASTAFAPATSALAPPAPAPVPAGLPEAQAAPDDCGDPSAWATRAELTEGRETSSHREVMEFLDRAAACDHRMVRVTFGHSLEGRPLPLLVVSPRVVEDHAGEGVLPPSAAADLASALVADDRLRVFIQANIHAGEVAGKESVLRLVRRIVAGEVELPADMDLLLAPIYNADGNEAVRLDHRPRQHGPVGGMGTRTNAMGLDLNRDQMKLDSPEARSLARLLGEWAPHVLADLHTTNGTRHAYHLTYSPPLHPATPESIDRFLRDEHFPRVTDAVEAEWGWHMWHYGNVFERDGQRGWWTFDHRPRFVTNYAGLRNRVGILSEAYSYLEFMDRILATERFVDQILEDLAPRTREVRALVETEWARDLRGTRIPIRAGFPDTAPDTEILMGDVETDLHPGTGAPLLRRTDVVVPDTMPAWIAFEGTEWARVPAAYLLPDPDPQVTERLRAHGIRLDPMAESDAGQTVQVEVFRVTGVESAPREFQGRVERTLEGEWHLEERSLPPGTLRIDLSQPEARLAVLLLEPRADDGLVNWAILGADAEAGDELPLLREPVPDP
ncbi:MAG: peptidase M14 [Gemmatimonadales bacterium]|nr:MAG: peptidase M14 [Gemmatimonadales bacterium]